MTAKKLSAKDKKEAEDFNLTVGTFLNNMDAMASQPKESIDNLKYYEITPRKAPIVTEDLIAHVRKLAGLGLTITQIHDYYGVTDKTWLKLRKKHPQLELAQKQGRSVNHEYVAGKLRKKIEQDNLGAIIFYLKTQAGWREKEYNNEGGNPNGTSTPKVSAVTLTVNDPVEAAKIYQQIMLGS